MRYADLACVQGFAPKKSPGGEPDICVLGDDGWVAAAELEGNGCQSLGSFLCDDGAHTCAPCVEYLIPFLVKKFACFGDGALNDREAGGIQGTFDDFLEHDCNVRGILTWFHDCGIAGCNGADKRSQREIDGEVVGATDHSATTCGKPGTSETATFRAAVQLTLSRARIQEGPS